jgi:hypothetical protein
MSYGMNMYGGGMGGGMGGGGMMPMVSSVCGSMLCLSILGGIAYYMMNSSGDDSSNQPPPAPVQETETKEESSSSSSGTGGILNILSGQNALTVGEKCVVTGKGADPEFQTPKGTQSQWAITKVGTDSSGKDYFTIQSQHRAFTLADCGNNYLMAKSNNCTGNNPVFGKPAPGDTRQYWYLKTEADGVTIQNVACATGNWPSYLVTSGSKATKPYYAYRTGTQFKMEKPFSA